MDRNIVPFNFVNWSTSKMIANNFETIKTKSNYFVITRHGWLLHFHMYMFLKIFINVYGHGVSVLFIKCQIHVTRWI